jgi:hypothetical protein
LHAADDGHGNTMITHDASNTVTLQGVALASLHASDFLFVCGKWQRSGTSRSAIPRSASAPRP